MSVWDRRARVVEVLDGDTVVCLLDQGFGTTITVSVRLEDTWAPEKHETGGVETRAYAAAWLATAAKLPGARADWPIVVETVRLRSDNSEAMSFARYIGRITRTDGRALGADVSAFVRAAGYGGGTGSAAA